MASWKTLKKKPPYLETLVKKAKQYQKKSGTAATISKNS